MFHRTKIAEYGTPDTRNAAWCREGLVFRVTGGLGKLTHVRGEEDDALEYPCQLLLNGVPIMQGHYSVSPTCEGMLATGYGIENVPCAELEKIRDTLNRGYPGIRAAFTALKPLLGLLDDGFYMLADTELAPTDGHGFFYSVPNELTVSAASCDQYYDSTLLAVTEGFPAFLYPTQSAASIREERVAEYRDMLRQGVEIRGLAYHETGFVCALLDGHHKAIAAAQLGKKLKCLTIIPVSGCSLEKSALPYGKRKVRELDFAGASIEMREAYTHEDVFPRYSRCPGLRITPGRLTDGRFDSMNASVSRAYHTLEQIGILSAAGVRNADVTEDDIQRWIRFPGRESRAMLTALLEYRAISDPESAYHIAEAIIRSGSRGLPEREAWQILLQRKDSVTEDLAAQYLAEHDARDDLWTLVMGYWDQ